MGLFVSSMSWMFDASSQAAVVCVDEYQIPEEGAAIPMDDEGAEGAQPLMALKAHDVLLSPNQPYAGATTAPDIDKSNVSSRPMARQFWQGRFDTPAPLVRSVLPSRRWPALSLEAEKNLLSYWTAEMISAAVISECEVRVFVSTSLPHGLMRALSQGLGRLGLAVSFWDHSGVLADYREWIMSQPGVLNIGLTASGLAIYIRPSTSIETQEEIVETLQEVGVDVEFHWE